MKYLLLLSSLLLINCIIQHREPSAFAQYEGRWSTSTGNDVYLVGDCYKMVNDSGCFTQSQSVGDTVYLSGENTTTWKIYPMKVVRSYFIIQEFKSKNDFEVYVVNY